MMNGDDQTESFSAPAEYEVGASATASSKTPKVTPAGNRASRLLHLIQLIQAGGFPTAADLAAKLGVTRRTIFRDVRELQKVGIAVHHRSDSGYVLAEELPETELSLNAAEALGLVLIAKLSRSLPDLPLFSQAADAADRMLQQLPPPLRRIYEQLTQVVSVEPGPHDQTPTDLDKCISLHHAIQHRHVVALLYHPTLRDTPNSVRILPLHLHLWRHRWYCFAKIEDTNEIRLFKLARILSLEVTEMTFSPIQFHPDDYLQGAWGICPGEQLESIDLLFDPKIARNVAEINWHPSQQYRMLSDGSCRMQFMVRGLSEIRWWILGYGEHVEVLSPPSLRQRIYEAAQIMAQRHKHSNHQVNKQIDE